MPTLDSGTAVVSSGPAVSGPTLLPPTDALPAPMPIAVGEPHPDASGRLRIVTGTEDDDRLEPNGGFAFGGGGNDTFVLTAQGGAEGPEHLGTILDFQAGDVLDLSQLGDAAVELGREGDASGGQRVSIDFDGDGKADGYVVLHENGAPAPDDTGVVSPGDDAFHILPFPMPGDDGVFTILPFPMPGDDGVFTILPFPMPGDGEAAIRLMSGFTVSADWVV